MGRVAFVCQAVLFRFFREDGDAVCARSLVDEQLVLFIVPFDIAGVADVDIHSPVAVHIGEADPGGPGFCTGHPCFFRDVFKAHTAFIQEQTIRQHIGAEIDIHQAVVVDVADAHPAAVVVVAVGVDVEGLVKGELVFKSDPAFAGGDTFEQSIGRRALFFCATGGQQENYAQVRCT